MNANQINDIFSSLSFIRIGEKNIFRNICLRDIKKEKYNFFIINTTKCSKWIYFDPSTKAYILITVHVYLISSSLFLLFATFYS